MKVEPFHGHRLSLIEIVTAVKGRELAWRAPLPGHFEQSVRIFCLWARARPCPHRKSLSGPSKAAMFQIGLEEEDEIWVDNLREIVFYLIGEDRIGRSAPGL